MNYSLFSISLVGVLLFLIPQPPVKTALSQLAASQSSSLQTAPQIAPQIACGRGRTVRARSPQEALVPYLISPRDTAVLSNRPDLRWNPVPGGDRYTVSLMNGGTTLWTTELSATQMSYPSDAEPLQPGIDYSLLIKATNGHDSSEDTAPQTFRLLSPAESRAFQQASLPAATATPDEVALLKANLYAGTGLYSDAIATLAARVEQGSQSPTVHRQLGDLYAQAGLTLLAESIYLPALALTANHLEEQARLQTSLADLYEAIGEPDEASRWLNQAKDSYTQLGNQHQVKQLEERLQPPQADA
jgi:hypothetical protein